MGFYRLATAEDFQIKPELPINNDLPEEVAQLIESGELTKAIIRLRAIRGIGMYDCKKICHSYHTFIRAKRDFEDGKPVYTEY